MIKQFSKQYSQIYSIEQLIIVSTFSLPFTLKILLRSEKQLTKRGISEAKNKFHSQKKKDWIISQITIFKLGIGVFSA